MTTSNPARLGLAFDRGPRRERWLRSALQGVWFFVVPAFLAGASLRYFVPTPGEARGSFAVVIARIASAQPILFAVALFLLFVSLLRYWRFYLPGGRFWGAPLQQTRPREDLETYAQGGHGRVARRGERAIGRIAHAGLRASGAAVLAGLAALVLRSHVLMLCRVLSASMLPTLTPGDLIATDRLAYGVKLPGIDGAAGQRLPRRGDIVVFQSPISEGASQPLVKRVIGLPGDRMGMNASRATINGWEVPACDAGVYLYVLPEGAIKARLLVEFLGDQAYLTIAAPPAREFPQPYQVQAGEVFVLGDNRNNSSDSRAWNEGRGGGLPVAQIDGRARWFVLGIRRDQRADASRLLTSLAGTDLHLEGLDVSALRNEIAKCLQRWPDQTHPPAPSAMAPVDPSPSPAPALRIIGQ